MRISSALLVMFSLLLFACQQNKKEKSEEIKVEVKMDATESGTKATVTIITDKNGKISEEIQIFEGAQDEVTEKVKTVTQKYEQTDATKKEKVKKIKLGLDPKSNSETEGEVTLTESNGKVKLEAHINGLTPGPHAIHLHEKADCSSEDGKSTGGHWNPTFENHGSWGAESGFHRCDIGNFEADASGHGMVKFETDLWCLGCADETKNIMGKAIIVHQGEDDLTSQPSGAAGARISCAALIPF